jgi:DNA repair photolyase
MSAERKRIKGRGAADNPQGRFEPRQFIADPESYDPEAGRPKTEFFRDSSRSILSTNESPDVPFDKGINPYRGCEHGCVYCFARPTHEYLGLSAGLDFETKIFVKHDAPALLRKALSAKSWTPQVVALSGNTDPYQPVERKLELTRRCLEVLAEFRNPVTIITKNHLVTRDIDILQRLAKYDAINVAVSVTSLDAELTRVMEPRTAPPQRRLQTIRELQDAGIPVGVLAAPIVPGLTDHEIPAILEAVATAGAVWASYIILRLPYGLKDLFESWLGDHFPDHKDKVLGRLRTMRGGGLNDPRYGARQRGRGVFADQIRSMFDIARRKAGLAAGGPELSTAHFRVPPSQPSLFEPPGA